MLCASCCDRFRQKRNSLVENEENEFEIDRRMPVLLSYLYNQKGDLLGERQQVVIMKRNEEGSYVPTIMSGGTVFQWKTNAYDGKKERIYVGSYVDNHGGVHWIQGDDGVAVPLQSGN